jgi:rod shape-determining protein MreD
MVNIATVNQVYNSYGVATLAIRGIVIIPMANSLLSILLYKISRKSVLKLKED